MPTGRRLQIAFLAFTLVVVIGTVGYVILGFEIIDALYQTVTTVTTVGFREIEPLGPAGQVFTMVLILLGVGSAFYMMGALIELLVEGQIGDVVGRKRMARRIESYDGHVVICGWGRVGRTIAQYVAGAGNQLVVIDMDEDRLADCPHPFILGDATEDSTLIDAGIKRARAVVAALEQDAANLFVVVSCRALRPELFIVARARSGVNEQKFLHAGADRVVNPQEIGGARMAAFLMQPHVAEFLDVVMHDGSLEFRLEEIPISPGCPIDGQTLRDAHLRDRTGALVLAIREPDGRFTTNPPPEAVLQSGQMAIIVGTDAQIHAMRDLVGAT